MCFCSRDPSQNSGGHEKADTLMFHSQLVWCHGLTESHIAAYQLSSGPHSQSLFQFPKNLSSEVQARFGRCRLCDVLHWWHSSKPASHYNITPHIHIHHHHHHRHTSASQRLPTYATLWLPTDEPLRLPIDAALQLPTYVAVQMLTDWHGHVAADWRGTAAADLRGTVAADLCGCRLTSLCGCRLKRHCVAANWQGNSSCT